MRKPPSVEKAEDAGALPAKGAARPVAAYRSKLGDGLRPDKALSPKEHLQWCLQNPKLQHEVMDFPALEEGEPSASVHVELPWPYVELAALAASVVLIRRSGVPTFCLQAGVQTDVTLRVPIGAESTVERWTLPNDALLLDLRADDALEIRYDAGGPGWRLYSSAFPYSSKGVLTTRRRTWRWGPQDLREPRPTIRFEGPLRWSAIRMEGNWRGIAPAEITRGRARLPRGVHSPAFVPGNPGSDDFPTVWYESGGTGAYAKILQRAGTEWTLRIKADGDFGVDVRASEGMRAPAL